MRRRKIHQSPTMRTRIFLDLCCCLFFMAVSSVLAQDEGAGSTSSDYIPVGYQTGPDPIKGSFSFAVSGTYRPRPDKQNDDGGAGSVGELVVVGTTTQGDVFRMNPDGYYDETTGQKVEIDAPSCFIGTVPLSSASTPENDLSFEHHVVIEIPSTVQECHRAALIDTNRLLVLGHAAGGGQQSILSPLYVQGGYIDNDNVGMMMDLSLDTIVTPSWALKGGHVLQQSSRSYPVATSVVHSSTGSPSDDDSTFLYVASMETDRSVQGWPTYQTIDFLHDPMEFFLYGDLFLDLVVTQTRVTTNKDDQQQLDEGEELKQTFEETWRVKFATAGGESVYTAGIETLNNGQLLGIAGTTAGYGPAFGLRTQDGDDTEGNDLDGFVSLLSPTTGHLLSSSDDDQSSPSSMRIASIDGQDDWVAGTCSSPHDPNAIYVVGSTMGRMSEAVPSDGKHPGSIHAFLLKLQVVDDDEDDGSSTRMKIVWGRQLGANDGVDSSETTKVRGVTCTVTPDGEQVYYGGVVHDGAVLDLAGTTVSYGKDDIFVELVVAETGESKWIRQFGSSSDDSIAPRDGLVVPDDATGENNVIVVGSTYGSMYRVRDDAEEGKEDNADVFVTTISGYNGKIAKPVSHSPEVPPRPPPPKDEEGGDGLVDDNSLPNAPPSDGKTSTKNDTPQKPATTKNTDPDEQETPSTSGGDLPASTRFGIVSVFLIAGGLIAAMYCCFFGSCADKKLFCKSEETDRGRVLGYLNDFEVEDVDMRHSATGGWHCSYTGPLAHGVNHKEQQKKNLSSTPTKVSSSSVSGGLTTPLTGTTNILEDDLYTGAFLINDTESILRQEDGDDLEKDSESGGLDSSSTNRNGDISYNAYRNARWAREEDEEERASVSGLLSASNRHRRGGSRRNQSSGSSSLRETLAKRRSQDRRWGRGGVV